MSDQVTARGFKGKDQRPDNCEKLPFTAWELAIIELALRYYANGLSGSELARKQLFKLADRFSDSNPK